jgi:hypothetical protein
LLPLLSLEKGFQAVALDGPGYIEERVRPVRALVVLGNPRVFFVRGPWGAGRYGQYHVARGTDFLRPDFESEIYYLNREVYDLTPGSGERVQFLSDWNTAVAREAMPAPPMKEPENAYEFLMKANGWINSAFYDFIGRADNDQVFREDDFKSADAAAACFEKEPSELHRSMLDETVGGMTVTLIKRMIEHLEYLRDVYSADRETIKAWRAERIEAHDALDGVLARLNGDYEAYKVSPEFQRWQAICDVGPLEYPLSSQERTRRDDEWARRRFLPTTPTPAAPESQHEGDEA